MSGHRMLGIMSLHPRTSMPPSPPLSLDSMQPQFLMATSTNTIPNLRNIGLFHVLV